MSRCGCVHARVLEDVESCNCRIAVPKLKDQSDIFPKYRYVLAEDWTIYLNSLQRVMIGNEKYSLSTWLPKRNCCMDLLEVDGGRLTVKKCYAFDGCSGVPDGPRSLVGCMVHDIVRQAWLVDRSRCPWTKDDTEVFFQETLRRVDFWGHRLYPRMTGGIPGEIYSWWQRVCGEKPAKRCVSRYG